jgi:hypothetical protein
MLKDGDRKSTSEQMLRVVFLIKEKMLYSTLVRSLEETVMVVTKQIYHLQCFLSGRQAFYEKFLFL